MIKAVIFDVGGVLIRTPDRSSRLAWEKRLALAEWESEEIVFGGEVGTQAQLGAISDDELWRWVGRRLSLAEEALAQFRRDFWAGDRLDQALMGYIRSLRPRYQTAIISNATDALRQTLHDAYPVADAFDLLVISAEEGIMKPDHEIYRRTLARLDLSPEETIFVDDSCPNVLAAQEVGMHAIHFSVGLDIPAELARLGVTRHET